MLTISDLTICLFGNSFSGEVWQRCGRDCLYQKHDVEEDDAHVKDTRCVSGSKILSLVAVEVLGSGGVSYGNTIYPGCLLINLRRENYSAGFTSTSRFQVV